MDETRRKASERLQDVLRTEFRGDKDLMAYCAQVSRVTLNLYLKGKGAPNIDRMYDLVEVIGGHDPHWLAGRTDTDRPCGGAVDRFQYSTLSEYGKRRYRRAKALREVVDVNKEADDVRLTYERQMLEAALARTRQKCDDVQKSIGEPQPSQTS